MKLSFAVSAYCGLFFIFQVSGKVSLIGSTKVERGRNKYAWLLGASSECSVPCGEGVQTRKYECRMVENGNRVPDYYCIYKEKPKPEVKKCNEEACEFTWLVSKWSSCNVTCGFGMRNRLVRCGTKIQDKERFFTDDIFCKNPKPLEHKVCHEERCSHWRSGKWSKCSVTCGHGHSYRSIHCINENNGPCDSSKRPKNKKICYSGPCTASDPNRYENEEDDLKIQLYDINDENSWFLENNERNKEDVYGEYDLDFRKNFNNKVRKPFRKTENSAEETDMIQGAEEVGKPNDLIPSYTKNVEKSIKNYRYIQKMECDNCSLSLTIADDQTIIFLLQNSTIDLVCENSGMDNVMWLRNEAVILKREVLKLRRVTNVDNGIYICIRNNTLSKVAVSVIDQVTELDSTVSSELKILKLEEPIRVVPNADLYLHFFTNYGALFLPPNVSTDNFVGQELVCSVSTNVFSMIVDVSLCDAETVNLLSYISTQDPVYRWEHSDWSECFAECMGEGLGKQTREVWCQSPAGHRVDEYMCVTHGHMKVATETQCHNEECKAHWIAGPYSQCQGVCGRFGQRRRQVQCTWGGNKVLDEALCDPQFKPVETLVCPMDCSSDEEEEKCEDMKECHSIDPVERCSEGNIAFCCKFCQA